MAFTDPLIGKQLGDYRIVDILGRGGMARVYRGYDEKLDRYAAVKVIDAGLVTTENEEEYRARFQREARAIARLRHPNIVGIYQFGEIESLYYMAMIFIEGRDLGQVLREHATQGKMIGGEQVLRIIHDITGALDYAHAGGVIHRDVKPSNIMVTPEGHAVLTDFGLALSVPEGSVGNTFGSAHYIAPEQAISSNQAVPQSDLYSLGVVMYQMLTGKVPFDDPSAMSVALKHLSDPPPPPRLYNPALSSEVEQVVLKALEKEIVNRYPSGAAMAMALEKALGISTIQDKYLPPLPPTSTAEIARVQEPEVSDISPTILFTESPSIPNPLPAAPGGTLPFAPAEKTARQTTPVLPIVIGLALLLLAVGAVIMLGGGMNNPTSIIAAASETPTAPAALVTDEATPEATAETTNEATNEATAEPTPTRTPRRSPTPEATAEVTTEATNEVTAEPTPTRTPRRSTRTAALADVTETATPTRTPRRMTTAVPIATTTPTPRRSATPTRTTAPTAVAAARTNDAPVLLVYNDRTLLLVNQSNERVDVSGLIFEQRTAQGRTLSFSSDQWSNGSSPTWGLPAGDCFQIWKNDFLDVDPPSACSDRAAWRSVGAQRWFWLSEDADAVFIVRRGSTTLAECAVADGECAFDPD